MWERFDDYIMYAVLNNSYIVPCVRLPQPANGAISCSLGDDGVASFEDTCTFTCNSGYEVRGSSMRTCQSDESWSGMTTTCARGRC